MTSDYPRVLFVTPLAFNHFTGGGVTFSNLFRDWPKDRLFTVHHDSLPLSTDVCENYFALGPEELPLAGPLETLRRLASGKDRSAPVSDSSAVSSGTATGVRGSVLRRTVFKLTEAVFGKSGFPAAARLTERLAAWIEQARPDVIYTILGSIEMMELVCQIRARFNLPVVVHLMDDWRVDRERGGLLSPLRRRRLLGLFDESMRTASGHLAICDAMAQAYDAEFGAPFEAIQNVVDSDEWLSRARADVTPGRPAKLLYAGSLYPNVQLPSLLDTAAAVDRLRAGGMGIALEVMCPDFMIAPHRAQFAPYEGTSIVPQVPRARYFETICAADVLLLPASFEEDAVRLLRYSMPTKVPEYLVSGVPILLYGPPAIAQIGYAKQESWGLVVEGRNSNALEPAIKRIVEDNGLRRTLVAQAKRTAAARHDSKRVRERFRAALRRASGVGGVQTYREAT